MYFTLLKDNTKDPAFGEGVIQKYQTSKGDKNMVKNHLKIAGDRNQKGSTKSRE